MDATMYEHWQQVKPEDWHWSPYFTPREMADKNDGSLLLVPKFMHLLTGLRVACDFGFPVNSGFRSDVHDQAIGGKGVHPTGEAIDLGLYGERALAVIAGAKSLGFTGVGIKQHGSRYGRFIHLDTLDRERFPNHPRPWVWGYP